MSTNAVNRAIEAALRKTGLPYEIKNGSKHKKVFLAGKFILAICHSPGRGRDAKHAEAAIAKRLRELECREV